MEKEILVSRGFYPFFFTQKFCYWQRDLAPMAPPAMASTCWLSQPFIHSRWAISSLSSLTWISWKWNFKFPWWFLCVDTGDFPKRTQSRSSLGSHGRRACLKFYVLYIPSTLCVCGTCVPIRNRIVKRDCLYRLSTPSLKKKFESFFDYCLNVGSSAADGEIPSYFFGTGRNSSHLINTHEELFLNVSQENFEKGLEEKKNSKK